MATDRGFSTTAVHAGDVHARAKDGTAGGVALSSTFTFASADEAREVVMGADEGFVYSRWGNPTVRALEAKVAALEGAERAVALASGMAAIYGVLGTFLRPGDHVLLPRAVYGETLRLARVRLAPGGVETSTADMSDLAAVERALRPNTKVVWTETPANPTLAVTDLAAVVELARARGARVVTDNTFATPYHQTPLALGVDLVVHSATKALCGHGDAIGGIVAGREAEVGQVAEEAVRATGASMAPMNAFLIARGAQTLGVRMRTMAETAQSLAERLAGHPAVTAVHYPGLRSHPGHAVAARQMRRGYGSVLAFEVRGGLAAAKALYDRVALIQRAVSLGDVRSLITHAATTTHAAMAPEERRAAGIEDGLLRVSVGVEEVDDLWCDLSGALPT